MTDEGPSAHLSGICLSGRQEGQLLGEHRLACGDDMIHELGHMIASGSCVDEARPERIRTVHDG
jgi:hypothetical protein